MQQFAPLLLAMGLSALAHFSFLYGFKLKAPGDALSVGEELHARLQSVEPARMQDLLGPPPEKKYRRIAATHRELPAVAPPEPEPNASSAGSHLPEPAEAQAAAIPLLADTATYTVRELDVFPKPLLAIQPPFPRRASDDRVSGYVTLDLVIDQQGVVEEAKVLEANPEGYFEEAALESFKAAHFSPGYRDGTPVRSRLAVKVDFELGRNASATDANR
ncbi:MAG: energy transducer TonB [Betaproteobacteria bacterium]|nr:energy transducer TonB [Betaproteobacteria bacterium]